MNTADVHALLARLARDLGAALDELRAAYAALDAARSAPTQAAARKRVRSAQEDLQRCLDCYSSLRAALSGGAVG